MSKLYPDPIHKNIQDDRKDPLVESFIDLEALVDNDNDRREVIDSIEENRELNDLFFRLLPTKKSNERFNDSLMIQVKRRFAEEGMNLPKPFAVSSKSQEAKGTIAETVLDEILRWSYFYETYSKVFTSLFTDGIGFTHITLSDDGRPLFQVRSYAQVKFDPNCTDFNDHPSLESSTDWAIVSFDFPYNKGLEVAKSLSKKDWTGKILPGEPTVEEKEYRNIVDNYSDSGKAKMHRMGVRYAYHLPKNKFCVYMGASATKVYEGEIPFKVRNRYGDLEPRLPLVAFSASTTKRKGIPLSWCGAIKHVTNEYKEVLNKAMKTLKIQMNPFVFLYSDAGTSIIKQMQEAEKHQELGSLPLILAPGSERHTMDSMEPKVDIFTQLTQFLSMCQDKIAAILGMSPKQQEQVTQTFSEYERKNQLENQAISFVNKLNKKAFEMVYNYIIDLVVHSSVNIPKTKITYAFESDDPNMQEVPYSAAIIALKDWTGRFDVDTTIKMPVSENEKIATYNDIKQQLNGDSANQMMTKELAEANTTILWEKAKSRDIEANITKKLIADTYNAMVKAPPPMEGSQPKPPAQQKTVSNKLTDTIG